MKILGIDSSAKSASVAVTENGRVLSSFFVNTGLTHSQTLMPMIDNALKCADISLDNIDLIAVNKGPGSFTGIRIGVAAAKGIADTAGIKCCGVSTLLSMSYNLLPFNCIICAVMDARCSQVYTALFKNNDGHIERIMNDCAMAVSDLSDRLKEFTENIILVGDGADLCFRHFKDTIDNISIATEQYKYQNAIGVCYAASEINETEYINGYKLIPEYLRLPQAERELQNKIKKGE